MKKILILSVCLIMSGSTFANEVDTEDFSLDKKFEELDKEEDIATSDVVSDQHEGQGTIGKTYAGNLEESMRIINGKVEELSHKMDMMSKEMDGLKARLEATPAMQTTIAPVDMNADSKMQADMQGKIAGKKPSSKQAKIDFDKAFSHMQKGEYAIAEKDFEAFVETYPEEKLSGLAYFWLGETFFTQKYFEKSALNYLYSVKKFPHSSKVALATYKLGLSLANIGKKQESCRVLKTFLDEYKDFQANVRSSALSKFNELECSKME